MKKLFKSLFLPCLMVILLGVSGSIKGQNTLSYDIHNYYEFGQYTYKIYLYCPGYISGNTLIDEQLMPAAISRINSSGMSVLDPMCTAVQTKRVSTLWGTCKIVAERVETGERVEKIIPNNKDLFVRLQIGEKLFGGKNMQLSYQLN